MLVAYLALAATEYFSGVKSRYFKNSTEEHISTQYQMRKTKQSLKVLIQKALSFIAGRHEIQQFTCEITPQIMRITFGM